MNESHPNQTTESPVAVVKRDGFAAPFQVDKIRSAIERAGDATGEFDHARAAEPAADVAAQLRRRVPGIEHVQDLVERTLQRAGHFETARAYIVYRERRLSVRRDRACAVDVERSVNEYLHQQDWRVNANANQGYSLGG